MVQDNNAYEVWQHLNKEYAPRVGKRMKFTTQAIEFDGAWEEERVYQDHPIKEEEKSVEDSDKLQVDPKVDDDEDYEDHPIKEEESGTQDVNKKEKCLSGEEGNEYFKCHDNQDEQHGMEKMIVETSDEMVVPNEIMEQGKQQITMTESVSENPKFQSEEKEKTKRKTPMVLTCGRKTLKLMKGKWMQRIQVKMEMKSRLSQSGRKNKWKTLKWKVSGSLKRQRNKCMNLW